MTIRHWTLAVLLGAVFSPSVPLAAQAGVDGEKAACTSARADHCAEEFFDNTGVFFEDLAAARTLFDNAKWVSGQTCRKIRDATFIDAMFSGDVRVTTPAGEAIDQTITGAHIVGAIGPHLQVITRGMAGSELLVAVLHEAAHHAGYPNHQAAEYAAQNCIDDEDDEDDDDPGGNTGTTETCTETLEWVPPVTVPVFVKPEPSTTEGGGTLPGPPGVTPTPLPPVVVGFDSGKWVDVVIEKGYWETVKECTLN